MRKKKSLNGLNGFSAEDVGNLNDKYLPLNAYWKKLIGNPYHGFYALVHGSAGSGKSTLMLQLGQYWADTFGKKVAIISYEEGRKFTMQEKIKRLNIDAPNLFIFENFKEMQSLGLKVEDCSMVIIDSLQTGGITAAKLRDFRETHPKVSVIAIQQQTKNGKFKGNNEFAHDSDVIIEVLDGKANSFAKNRLGLPSEVEINF